MPFIFHPLKKSGPSLSKISFMLALLALVGQINPAHAQLGISVSPVTPQMTATGMNETAVKINVTTKNASRPDNALILYTSEFGKTTRTNPYGVEIIATPLEASKSEAAKHSGIAEGNDYYKVEKVSNIWECQKQGELKDCGNATIPEKGLVLSATGEKRQALLDSLKPGSLFTLNESWFTQTPFKVNVINPNQSNNALGCSFPGCRGGQQLVIYNRDYGKPATETNEYGFEVTVRNGVVVAQEGSDSLIPIEGDPFTNFIVSGHGTARTWLIQNAPIGAKLTLNQLSTPVPMTAPPLSNLINPAIPVLPAAIEILSTIDYNTYKYQLGQRLSESRCLKPGSSCSGSFTSFQKQIELKQQEADKLYAQGQQSKAVKLLSAALETVNHKLWQEFPSFPSSAVKGVWHRPVEHNKAEIGRTLDSMKRAGLNTIFLESVFHGFTIFPSETMQTYGLPEENPKFAGFDALKAWVEEAHQRDMQIHVWMHTFYAGTKAFQAPGPILSKYPTWANVQYSALINRKIDPKINLANQATYTGTLRNINALTTVDNNPLATGLVIKETPKTPVSSTLENGGYFLDPANPAVQQFILALTQEIVTRYDVDGLQLDYIRYPSAFPKDRYSYLKTTWGYTEHARAAFRDRTGFDPTVIDYKKDPDLWQEWDNFKSSQVSSVVKQVHDMTMRVNKEQRKHHPVKLSAVIFPLISAAREQKSQDWRLWGLNGWVDFLSPITLTSSVKVVSTDTQNVLAETQRRVPVLTGVFGAFNGNSAELLLQQIDAAKEAGAQNFGIFDSAHLTGRMLEALSVSQGQNDSPPVPKP